MYFSMIKIYPPPGNEHRVIDVLDSLKGPISAVADCLACSITVETDGTGAVCYSDQWRTREALDKHLRSALFSRLLEAMECSHQSPDIAFYDVTEVGSLKLVEQARANQ